MQARDDLERQPLAPPPNVELPIFVYGLLKPGELGHDQVQAEVDRSDDATAMGALPILDGMPIFDPNLSGHVSGSVLALTVQGYEAVSAFEPSSIYAWATTRVRVGDFDSDQTVESNVLVATVDEDGRSVVGQVTARARGAWVDPRGESVTFRKVAEEWLECNPAKRASTRARDDSALRTHVLPAIGDRRIGSLTPADIRGLVGRWNESLAPRSVGRVCTARRGRC